MYKNMPRTFFDLNLLANMVAKLGNIVGEHVKFDMFATNVGQFGHTLRNTVRLIYEYGLSVGSVRLW